MDNVLTEWWTESRDQRLGVDKSRAEQLEGRVRN